MYVRGYLQCSENGRVVTIEVIIDYPVAGQIGPKQNRPQVKSVPGQIVPSQIGPSQIVPKSNRP